VVGLDDDERVRHAARLLLSGYDAESVVAICGLPLDQVRAIASTGVDELGGAPR
jgi:hypothetical protein